MKVCAVTGPGIRLVAALGFFVGMAMTVRAADESLQRQAAFQQAVAAVDQSIVRIETVGGVDLIGETLTSSAPTTGCVVRADGYIMTSRFNFLSNPSSVIVTLFDGRRFAAQVVSSDLSRMVTLLKIPAQDLTPLVPVPPKEVRVGQWALALGRTFDPKFPNVSAGIVSAVNRVWGRALQTDAKTSPVNYGGPLIDLTGRCLGVIVPLSPDAQGETAGVEWYDSGIGFAVPLTDILNVLPRLIAGETLKPGLMGLGFEDRGPVSGEAQVIRVRPESPADQAGLLVDDVITACNGQTIARLNDLKHLLGSMYAEDVVHLKVRRGDQTLEKELTLIDSLKAFQFPYLGVLPDRRIPEHPQGLAVRGVIPGSPAEQAGLKAGDLIQQAAHEAVHSREELARQVWRLHVEESLPLEIDRQGKRESISATLAALPAEPTGKLELAAIPRPERPVEAKAGRFNEKLPDDGLSFWVYVPENYRPDYRWGMLVWLHPTGDPLESEALRVWSSVCQSRGLILVGPRTPDVSGWSAEQQEPVKQVMDWVQDRYQIDPARVVVMGKESSAPFASQVAFKYRDLVRGLLILGAPLRVVPPDVDPDFPLEMVFVSAPDSPVHRQVARVVQILLKMNFPAWVIEDPQSMEEAFPAETVSRLAVWLDSLDRL